MKVEVECVGEDPDGLRALFPYNFVFFFLRGTRVRDVWAVQRGFLTSNMDRARLAAPSELFVHLAVCTAEQIARRCGGARCKLKPPLTPA